MQNSVFFNVKYELIRIEKEAQKVKQLLNKKFAERSKVVTSKSNLASVFGEPPANRTLNLLIKSQLLCQLS